MSTPEVFLAVKSHLVEPIPLQARTPSASNINIKFPKDAVRDTHCTYSHLLKYMYSMSTAVKWWKWSNIKKLGSKLKMDIQSQKQAEALKLFFNEEQVSVCDFCAATQVARSVTISAQKISKTAKS